jgi:hypothetical protein
MDRLVIDKLSTRSTLRGTSRPARFHHSIDRYGALSACAYLSFSIFNNDAPLCFMDTPSLPHHGRCFGPAKIVRAVLSRGSFA